jgi:hypothetical protein
METYNKDIVTNPNSSNPEPVRERNRNGRVFAGLLVVGVGLIFLLDRTGYYYFPHWLISWKTMLIAIGLFVGFKHSFRNFSWLPLVVIGSIFLLGDIFPYTDISDYLWPMAIIAVGLFIIFRPGKKKFDWRDWDAKNNAINASDDHLDSTVIFGAVKKNVISKNFRGGDITSIFGGTDVNLMQADVDGKIVLDVTAIFGGTKLIVPPHWKIETKDIVAIFGGVEDKRPQLADASMVNEKKVLVLEGAVVFGGIDIKSY